MVSYIAPALTPKSGNPTFRVYSVDPVTFAILDYIVYYTNISSPTYQSGPIWEELYSVKEAYGSLLDPPVTDASAELTPAFWHNLTVLFENDDDIFQAYYARKSRDYDTATCDSSCKTSEICQLRASQSQYNCGTVTAGTNFKRDTSSNTSSNTGECDGSAVIPILSAYAGTGLSDFKDALLKQMGEVWLNTIVPDNYTTTTS
jgi:sphingomyelin phosphodiesterase